MIINIAPNKTTYGVRSLSATHYNQRNNERQDMKLDNFQLIMNLQSEQRHTRIYHLIFALSHVIGNIQLRLNRIPVLQHMQVRFCVNSVIDNVVFIDNLESIVYIHHCTENN